LYRYAVAKNVVQDTSNASSPNNNLGGGASQRSAAERAADGESASADRKTMQEMAAKVEAALARSQLAQERIHAAAREAVKEAREAAAKVREDWSKASSSRASWRSGRSAGSARSDSDWGGGARNSRGGLPEAVPAKQWATGDEVKGKTDMFDRFMGSLSAININAESSTARGLSLEDEINDENRGDGGDGGGEGGLIDDDDMRLSELSASPTDGATPEKKQPPKQATTHSGTMYGALSVSLVGEAREGEKLTLEVDQSALPPGAGAVNVRWQRGSKVGAPPTRSSSIGYGGYGGGRVGAMGVGAVGGAGGVGGLDDGGAVQVEFN
jgi:hypothetical protein